MVKLNKIYTRTGDAGTTALGTGARLAKDAPRIAAYGTVDETNAAIGVARVHLRDGRAASDAMDGWLARIQNDLFDLGADLCMPDDGKPKDYEPLRVSESQVGWLEERMDAMNEEMDALKSFVLPGGTEGAAALHLARTICRRAERELVTLAAIDDEPVGDAAMKYVNRLSDFLFVASRYVNEKGRGDVLWVPGQNR
ncbi:MAG: cob(I)yrinic acid a,c-diamide adenosyltransferase [Pseudomonadota bacterium]